MGMEIRRIDADERALLSVPIQAYGFQPSPAPAGVLERLRDDNQRYYRDHVTLVAEVDGVAVADTSAVPMRQNVRGAVYPMAGIAGVATAPQARRRGYARALVTEILGVMRDGGHVVSALYPFRPSFYERLGYVGLPRTRTVTFSPSGVAGLLRADLGGSVRWGPVDDHFDAYLAITARLLTRQHGFAVLPDSRMAQLRDAGDRWLATAWVGQEVVGAVTYRIDGFGGDLIADDLLIISPLGRALLLQFFAAHADQAARIIVTVPAGEMPELWATDFEAVTQATTSFPRSPAPMARVLSVEGLAGMPAGGGAAVVDIVDDLYTAGRYVLEGTAGTLTVRRAGAEAPEATLTSAGLSALVFGVLDPYDLNIRGLGEVPAEPAARLRNLFPPRIPYLHASF
jgi:predicted acetyltransferase